MTRLFNCLRYCAWLLPAAISTVIAAPAVTGSSGTPSQGSQLTVTGSGFGTKSPVSPLKWDDFEAGAVGSTVGNGWYTWTNLTGHEPRYSNAKPRTGTKGTKTAFQDFTNGAYNSTLGLTNQNIRKVYLSGWYFITNGGNETRNYKMLALRTGPPGDWNSPNIRMDQHPNDGWGNDGEIYTGEEATPVCGGTGSADRIPARDYSIGPGLYAGAWHRFEVWIDTDSAGPNGVYTVWRDLKTWASISGRILTKDCPFSNLYLSSYYTNDGVGSPEPWAQIHWDELYVDTTRARVEICDTSSWTARTRCEVQLPTAWSGTSVTFTVNQGAFADGSTGYVYVVEPGGTVNANGQSIVFTGGTANSPPADVNGVKRSDLSGS